MIWMREREKEGKKERERMGRKKERKKEREWGDSEKKSFGLSTVPAFFVTPEFLTPILPIKFSMDSLYPKFLHLNMHLSLLET